MPHALAMPPSSFQAVILCGPGVSLNTFTSTPDEFPKALVPIANRPMIWYPLDWCYRMGITSRCHLANLSHTSLFCYWKNEFFLVRHDIFAQRSMSYHYIIPTIGNVGDSLGICKAIFPSYFASSPYHPRIYILSSKHLVAV